LATPPFDFGAPLREAREAHAALQEIQQSGRAIAGAYRMAADIHVRQPRDPNDPFGMVEALRQQSVADSLVESVKDRAKLRASMSPFPYSLVAQQNALAQAMTDAPPPVAAGYATETLGLPRPKIDRQDLERAWEWLKFSWKSLPFPQRWIAQTILEQTVLYGAEWAYGRLKAEYENGNLQFPVLPPIGRPGPYGPGLPVMAQRAWQGRPSIS